MRLTPESDSTQHSTERMKGEKYNLIQLNFSIQAAPQRLPNRWPVTSASWSALCLNHIFPRATHKPANTRTSAIVTTRNRLNIIAAHEWVSILLSVYWLFPRSPVIISAMHFLFVVVIIIIIGYRSVYDSFISDYEFVPRISWAPHLQLIEFFAAAEESYAAMWDRNENILWTNMRSWKNFH